MADLMSDELTAVRARLGWRPGGSPDQRCAVAGYDGSSASGAALAYASGWAERTLGAVVIVHVDPLAGTTMAECTCAMAGVLAPDIPSRDMSSDLDEAMQQVSACWAYLNVRGDVADELERVADALGADLIVVGKSRRTRLRVTSSVGRRLLGSTHHILVVV
jgi:hypothetical protein